MIETMDKFFEAQINNYNFRYSGGNIIEVSKIGDRQRTVLFEITVHELETKKEFDTEISFWFMQNGANL
jgi:hypothetical protein